MIGTTATRLGFDRRTTLRHWTVLVCRVALVPTLVFAVLSGQPSPTELPGNRPSGQPERHRLLRLPPPDNSPPDDLHGRGLAPPPPDTPVDPAVTPPDRPACASLAGRVVTRAVPLAVPSPALPGWASRNPAGRAMTPVTRWLLYVAASYVALLASVYGLASASTWNAAPSPVALYGAPPPGSTHRGRGRRRSSWRPVEAVPVAVGGSTAGLCRLLTDTEGSVSLVDARGGQRILDVPYE